MRRVLEIIGGFLVGALLVGLVLWAVLEQIAPLT